VFAACVGGDLLFIAFTADRGAHWTAMDLPRTPSLVGGPPDGTNPDHGDKLSVRHFGPIVAPGEPEDDEEEPGGQGFLHFAITVDPGNSNLVYVGGDRQPLPSFIGATNFTGRLFRGNTAIAPTGAIPSPQWAHITNSNAIPEIPGGGTASNSSPHADSRSLAFDAAGNLVNTNDGGIAKRTRPRDNTGDWFSLVGNLQVAELHDAAYDPNSATLYGGSQDTGTPEQIAYGTRTWRDNSAGDGGDAAVDTLARPGFSIRYVSNQFLFGFKRQMFDGRGVQVPDPDTGEFDHFLFLIRNDGDDELFGGFVTPFTTNRVQGNRLMISANVFFESFDRGDHITELRDASGFGAFAGAHGMAYGHAANPDMFYAAEFGQLLVRQTVGSPVVFRSFPQSNTTFFSSEDVVMGNNPQTAFVAGNTFDGPTTRPTVLVTTDAGATFSDLTGDLTTVTSGFLRAIEFVPATPSSGSKIVVSGDGGVFISPTNAGAWSRVGTNLPRALVFDTDYSSLDDLLIVGMLGRGSFSVCNVSKLNAGGAAADTTKPRFTFVPPAVSVADCHSTPDLGQAVAIDNCRQPVTVTNDAPATFPTGITTVTWTARDAAGNVATATQQVVVFLGDDATCCPAGTNVIRGTAGNDRITGTAGADCILGLGGNDTIDARGGNDLVSGGAGNDTIQGGDGNDVISAGLGDDIVDSGNGNDAISGGAGRDTIAAGLGSDFVDGGDEFDTCSVPPDGTDVVLSCNP
jgi:Ca2+-binding RTX toxin-like protein